MEKKAESAIRELNKKIESLQAKREAVIRKEKARKAKAQEKWTTLFIKSFLPHVLTAFGEDYEEEILPENLADKAGRALLSMKEDQNLRRMDADLSKSDKETASDEKTEDAS